MAQDMSEMFAEQQSSAIEWHGELVHSMVSIEAPPEVLKIRFLSASDAPVQGMSFSVDRGLLVVNDDEARDMVLWSDTAPDVVDIQVRRKSARRQPVLKVWNVWRVGLDVTQAWLGNAAMRVEGDLAIGRIEFHCSDGEGEPDFSDLVVAVTVE